MLTGFILAAGFGTRLKPLTDHIPKALAPVCGKPLLYRALEFCSQQGMERLGVNSFHFPEQMRAFREHSSIDFSLFQETEKIRGTGGALYFARDFLTQSDFFFACNVDILANVDRRSLFKKFLSFNCSAGLVAIPLESGGSIYYDKVTKKYGGAKTDPGASGNRAEFLGMAFYKREFLSILGPDDFSILPLWQRAQKQGLNVKVIEVEASYWKDAGTPKALAAAHFDFFDKKYPVSIPSYLIIDYTKRQAYPTHFSSREISKLGPNVWCESDKIPDDAFIENSVVFRNAVLTHGKSYKNALVTQWGEMTF